MQQNNYGLPKPAASITTNELALWLKLKPQSIRKRYWQTGSYFGCRPIKLSNGLLRWPTDAILKMLEGEVNHD